MKRVVEFCSDGGGTVLVEVDEPAAVGGTVRAGREDGLPEQARQSFEAALGTVQPAAEGLLARLRALGDPPDQVSVEFGVKLSGSLGAIIASTSAEANYKVTLSWRREERRSG